MATPAKDETKPIDETVPGGKYITGDRYTDAEGKDLGPVSKSDLEVDATPATEADAITVQPAAKKK